MELMEGENRTTREQMDGVSSDGDNRGSRRVEPRSNEGG